MGLVSLLATVELISSSSFSSQGSSTNQKNSDTSPVRILVFPIVNIDAYTMNIQEVGQGELRYNLGGNTTNTLWDSEENMVARKFRYESQLTVGFDLNRNYPNAQTTIAAEVFSEPETCAIRDVVHRYNVTHALSFHSMSHGSRPRCIIHPYASPARSFLTDMPKNRAKVYRKWSTIMSNDGNFF
jgi:hypothetical protein